MNNSSELERTLEEFFIDNPFPSKAKCPSPRTLLKLLRSELSEKKQKKVSAHISCCRSCVREIKFIHSMLRAEQTADQDLTLILKKRDRILVRTKKPLRFPHFKPAWSFRTIWIVTLCVVLAASYFLFNLRKPAIERETTVSLALIHPTEKHVNKSELIFKWEAVPESEYSILEIFDDSLNLVWRSDRILLNRLEPEEALIKILRPEDTYLWMVTSFLTSGLKVESKLAKFTLKKPEIESPR